jgi:hypothetical protein
MFNVVAVGLACTSCSDGEMVSNRSGLNWIVDLPVLPCLLLATEQITPLAVGLTTHVLHPPSSCSNGLIQYHNAAEAQAVR